MKSTNIFWLQSPLLACALMLTACGTIKTKDRNTEEVSRIQKAALVAFTADLPARNSVALNLNSGKAQGAAGGSMMSQVSPVGDQMVQAIQKSFGEKMKWKMISTDAMTKTAPYTAAYKATMEGWQNKMPPPSGINRYLATGLMDADGLRIMGPEGRKKLMDGLGVDALIVSRVNVMLNGTTVMGIGARHPQTRVFFEVFKRDVERPVWFETLSGKEMESVGKTGLTIDETKIAELGLESLKDGLSQLQ